MTLKKVDNKEKMKTKSRLKRKNSLKCVHGITLMLEQAIAQIGIKFVYCNSYRLRAWHNFQF